MKQNIFVLPTNGESRLGYLTKKGKEVYKDLRLFDKPMPNILDSENQHIYITNDNEDRKFMDWVYSIRGFIGQFGTFENSYEKECKKIILTTDPKLIADGVQSIDDDFLNWFVNNSSCEYVKVEKLDTFKKTNEVYVDEIAGGNYYEIIKQYKIILPKETSKQESIEEAFEKYANKEASNLTPTVEEVAKSSFIEGANWMSKTMYSEEDLHSAFEAGMMFIGEDKGSFKEWFEQHKKK